MKMSDAFPSKYLKADVDVPDFDDGGIVFTISHVEMADVGSLDSPESKPVVYFEESSKGLVLNKTNAAALSTACKSDDTDDWVGKRVKLYAKDVEYQGKMVRGIRVNSRLAPPAQQPPPRSAAKPAVAQDSGEDIPF